MVPPLSSRHATALAHTPVRGNPVVQPALLDLRDNPLAIGCLIFIQRLALDKKDAVPLSVGDLIAYDPAITREQAQQAITRLIASNWAIKRMSEHGRKPFYLPGWGRVRGNVRPWNFAARSLGRPRRLPIYNVDIRLLDMCLGRLQPRARGRAVISRPVERPLLGLADIGAYALIMAGLSVDVLAPAHDRFSRSARVVSNDGIPEVPGYVH